MGSCSGFGSDSRFRCWVPLVALLLLVTAAPAVRVQTARPFASQIAQLSEPGGYFDTDNLISNERSYPQVMPELRAAGRQGGVYIGVGPDQNFSYIAAVRPSLAFIVDVRRDNLLLHLFLKALFTTSETRIGYLCALFACAPPSDLAEWKTAPIARLVDYVQKRPSAAPVAAADTRRIDDIIRSFGVPLTEEDFATIHRFHSRFVDEGVELQFNTTGRPPQSDYPTYRELLVETDPSGRPGNFLGSEESYAFVRSMQRRDLIIPVVGNLAGPSALRKIGGVMAEQGHALSALYASNVEFYLFPSPAFGHFIANLATLPRTPRSLIIRSAFRGYSRSPYGSTSLVQPVDELVTGWAAGRIRSYDDLIP